MIDHIKHVHIIITNILLILERNSCNLGNAIQDVIQYCLFCFILPALFMMTFIIIIIMFVYA